MMLVVNKENGSYGVKCVEFFPRFKQRVVFCLCEANGGFSAKFTKYNLVVHVLRVCLDKTYFAETEN